MNEKAHILLKDVLYLDKSGFRPGYVYSKGDAIGDVGEEPEPEYELSEMLYEMDKRAIVLHGYSAIIDTYEFAFRGYGAIDYSVFTKAELKVLAEYGLSEALSHGITLPIIASPMPEIAVEVLRKAGLPGAVISSEEIAAPANVITMKIRNGKVYRGDGLVCNMSAICRPGELREGCAFLDLRGILNYSAALHLAGELVGGVEKLYELLVSPYVALGLDGGYIERGNLSDIVLFDLKNPQNVCPVKSQEGYWAIVKRFNRPDIVVVRGEVAYERGEHIAYTITPKALSFVFEK